MLFNQKLNSLKAKILAQNRGIDLTEDSTIELQLILKRMGYSERAAKEILKWYEKSNSQTEGHVERSLHSNDTCQQKYER